MRERGFSKKKARSGVVYHGLELPVYNDHQGNV